MATFGRAISSLDISQRRTSNEWQRERGDHRSWLIDDHFLFLLHPLMGVSPRFFIVCVTFTPHPLTRKKSCVFYCNLQQQTLPCVWQVILFQSTSQYIGLSMPMPPPMPIVTDGNRESRLQSPTYNFH